MEAQGIADTAVETDRTPRLMAWWRFEEGNGTTVADASGNGHTLTAVGEPLWTTGECGGAITLDGATQWLTTEGPVLQTNRSYSVAAWLRLDRASLGEHLRLPPGWFAVTAISQVGPSAMSPTHTPFYLGARAIDEETAGVVKWCFEVAPVDGTIEALEAGPPWPYVWENAFSTDVLDDAVLDQWVFLLGIFDAEELMTTLYLPATGDRGRAALVDNWPLWHAEGPLQIGRAVWLGDPVDHWHGSIGPVRLFSGVLSESDAKQLYLADLER